MKTQIDIWLAKTFGMQWVHLCNSLPGVVPAGVVVKEIDRIKIYEIPVEVLRESKNFRYVVLANNESAHFTLCAAFNAGHNLRHSAIVDKKGWLADLVNHTGSLTLQVAGWGMSVVSLGVAINLFN